jgi:hypothetical protein
MVNQSKIRSRSHRSTADGMKLRMPKKREGEPQIHPRVLELALLRLLRAGRLLVAVQLSQVGAHDLDLCVGSGAVLVPHDHLHLEHSLPTGLQNYIHLRLHLAASLRLLAGCSFQKAAEAGGRPNK